MSLQLTIGKSEITGRGSDVVGHFSIGGAFSSQNCQVQFIKSFSDFTVFYSGVWDGEMISGLWTKNYGSYMESGEFEIWPVKGNESLAIEVEEPAQLSDALFA